MKAPEIIPGDPLIKMNFNVKNQNTDNKISKYCEMQLKNFPCLLFVF